MAEPETPQRVLIFTPDQLAIAIGPNREVLVHLEGFERAAGLTPGLWVMIRMSAAEARQFAQSLFRMADEAEEGLPRA